MNKMKFFQGLDLRQILIIPFKPQGFGKIRNSLGIAQGLLFIALFHLLIVLVSSLLDAWHSGLDFFGGLVANTVIYTLPFFAFVIPILLVALVATAIAAVAKKQMDFAKLFGALSFSAIPNFYFEVIRKLAAVLFEAYSLETFILIPLSILWFWYIGTHAVKMASKFGTLGAFLTMLAASIITFAVLFVVYVIISILILSVLIL